MSQQVPQPQPQPSSSSRNFIPTQSQVKPTPRRVYEKFEKLSRKNSKKKSPSEETEAVLGQE